MTRVDVSRRLVKWAVDLWEYDIEYQPRTAIKAHTLSYFLTKMAGLGHEEVSRVFIDSALEGEEIV